MARNTCSSAVLGQAIAGLGAILLAVFCPQPGSASVLVPLGGAGQAAAAQWATRERAQLVAFDPSARRISVVAPSSISLIRALSYGFVPIAADLPPCSDPAAPLQTRTQSQTELQQG